MDYFNVLKYYFNIIFNQQAIFLNHTKNVKQKVKRVILINLKNLIKYSFGRFHVHFKIDTSDKNKTDYETLVKQSLAKGEYQDNIEIGLIKINKIIFNPQVETKLKKHCQLRTKKKQVEKCRIKSKSTYKIRKSLKGKGKKLSNIVLTTRMSLFEL